MKIVLRFYEDVIEKLSKIAEHTAKTVALLEEYLVGTVVMGSCGDGTYLPAVLRFL